MLCSERSNRKRSIFFAQTNFLNVKKRFFLSVITFYTLGTSRNSAGAVSVHNRGTAVDFLGPPCVLTVYLSASLSVCLSAVLYVILKGPRR